MYAAVSPYLALRGVDQRLCLLLHVGVEIDAGRMLTGEVPRMFQPLTLHSPACHPRN